MGGNPHGATPVTLPRSAEMVIINLQGRNLSLPKTVVKKGVDGWNSQVGDSWIIREMREKV